MLELADGATVKVPSGRGSIVAFVPSSGNAATFAVKLVTFAPDGASFEEDLQDISGAVVLSGARPRTGVFDVPNGTRVKVTRTGGTAVKVYFQEVVQSRRFLPPNLN